MLLNIFDYLICLRGMLDIIWIQTKTNNHEPVLTDADMIFINLYHKSLHFFIRNRRYGGQAQHS